MVVYVLKGEHLHSFAISSFHQRNEYVVDSYHLLITSFTVLAHKRILCMSGNNTNYLKRIFMLNNKSARFYVSTSPSSCTGPLLSEYIMSKANAPTLCLHSCFLIIKLYILLSHLKSTLKSSKILKIVRILWSHRNSFTIPAKFSYYLVALIYCRCKTTIYLGNFI